MPDIHPFEKVNTSHASGFGNMHEDDGAEKEANAVAERFTNSRDVLGDMGRAYGKNLSHIRFHKDASAAAKVDATGKAAVTKGNDVFFGKGVFDSPMGSVVAAHEVAHTMQQSGGYGMSHNVAFDSAQGFSWKGLGKGLLKGLKSIGGGIARGARRVAELPASILGGIGGFFGANKLFNKKNTDRGDKGDKSGELIAEDRIRDHTIATSAFQSSHIMTPGADGGFTRLFKGTASMLPDSINRDNPLARGAAWGAAIRNGLLEATMIPSLVRAFKSLRREDDDRTAGQKTGDFFKSFSQWTPVDLIRGIGHGAARLGRGIGRGVKSLWSRGIDTSYDISNRADADYASTQTDIDEDEDDDVVSPDDPAVVQLT